MDALVPVFVGFLLTTVLGGLLGTFLQRQSWSHQFRAQSEAQDLERATQVFEEVSRLLDRRLYRMRRLYWAMGAEPSSPTRAQASDRMEEYVTVVYEWNDGINRILALLERYFGPPARDRFDNDIGGQVRRLGESLEAIWRSLGIGRPGPVEQNTPDLKSVNLNPAFNRLADAIYEYNVELIRAIQDREVGRRRVSHAQDRDAE
jgi:hypothetical protein